MGDMPEPMLKGSQPHVASGAETRLARVRFQARTTEAEKILKRSHSSTTGGGLSPARSCGPGANYIGPEKQTVNRVGKRQRGAGRCKEAVTEAGVDSSPMGRDVGRQKSVAIRHEAPLA
jgi:hypothetical protein